MIHEMYAILFYFLVGLGVSLQPGAIMAGVHISEPLRGAGKRWIAFVFLSLIMLFGDMVLMHFLKQLYALPEAYTIVMDLLESDVVVAIVMLLLAVIILQVAGVLDMTHGERNLGFRYDQLKRNVLTPSWEERYVAMHGGSLGACIISLLYIVRAPLRSTWPYVLWALCCKLVTVFVNVVLITLAAQWGFMADMMATEIGLVDGGNMWVDTYIFTYLMCGYLFGHVLFHHDESKLRSDLSRVLRLVSNVLVVLMVVSFILVFVFIHIYKHG